MDTTPWNRETEPETEPSAGKPGGQARPNDNRLPRFAAGVRPAPGNQSGQSERRQAKGADGTHQEEITRIRTIDNRYSGSTVTANQHPCQQIATEVLGTPDAKHDRMLCQSA